MEVLRDFCSGETFLRSVPEYIERSNAAQTIFEILRFSEEGRIHRFSLDIYFVAGAAAASVTICILLKTCIYIHFHIQFISTSPSTLMS
jgi:hypothetical protein